METSPFVTPRLRDFFFNVLQKMENKKVFFFARLEGSPPVTVQNLLDSINEHPDEPHQLLIDTFITNTARFMRKSKLIEIGQLSEAQHKEVFAFVEQVMLQWYEKNKKDGLIQE